MPELPEVEVLRRSLESFLPGRRVESVGIFAPALREPLDRRSLNRAAKGRRFQGPRANLGAARGLSCTTRP